MKATGKPANAHAGAKPQTTSTRNGTATSTTSRAVTPTPGSASAGSLTERRSSTGTAAAASGGATRGSVTSLGNSFTPIFRRQASAESFRVRRARSFRGGLDRPVTASTPATSPSTSTTSPGTASTSATGLGVRSLPQSPATSRRCSTSAPLASAGSNWETQSVLSARGEFSADNIARNGTTFSARCNKYITHCAARVDDDHYLTPTQRTTRDLRRLRALLDSAHETIRQKDTEISRLKHEIITLRLGQSQNGTDGNQRASSGEDKDASAFNLNVSNDSLTLDRLDLSQVCLSADTENGNTSPTALDIRQHSNTTDSTLRLPSVDESGNLEFRTSSPHAEASHEQMPLPMAASISVCDSGTFDGVTSPSVSSKESCERPAALELEDRLGGDWESTERWVEWEEARLREENERKVAELNRQHAMEYQEMKEKYNDKVEALLQKLTDANTRFFEMRSQYDEGQLKIGQLELQLETLKLKAAWKPAATDVTSQTDGSFLRDHVDGSRSYSAQRDAIGGAKVTRHSAAQTDQVVAQSPTEMAALQARLDITEQELEKIRALYCEQLTALEDAQKVIASEMDEVAAPGCRAEKHSLTQDDELRKCVFESREVSPSYSPASPSVVNDQMLSTAPPESSERYYTEHMTTGTLIQKLLSRDSSCPGKLKEELPFTEMDLQSESPPISSTPAHSARSDAVPANVAPIDYIPVQVVPFNISADMLPPGSVPVKLAPPGSVPLQLASPGCVPLQLAPPSPVPLQVAPPGSGPLQNVQLEPGSCEMEPPMRLQFLRSALFHFLTDREDYAGHLKAIAAVLQFSEWEMHQVQQARAARR